ncbi:MAG TPA: AMP-binding protein, partial [Candidatus Sulfopaludibacter sp.]|nr:AMP-binding protein [Candidatus Sulfopaludibacter sp.]
MSAGIPQRQTWNYRANEPAGWGDILRSHLALRPDALAYEYCREDGGTHSVTYTRLEHQARAIGGFLHREGLQNRRVLLFYEPGLDYVTALFGCLLAGAVAVPLYPPKRRAAADSIRSIAANAEAEAILTTPLIEPVIRHAFDGSPELANVR